MRVQYEHSDRVRAMRYGGWVVVNDLVDDIGLVRAIDEGVQVLEQHRP